MAVRTKPEPVKKKRHRKRKWRLRKGPCLLLLLSICCLIVLGVRFVSFVQKRSAVAAWSKQESRQAAAQVQEETTAQEYEATEEETQTQEPPPDTRIDLMMIGDILAHPLVYNSGRKADGSYCFDHLFEHMKDDIAEADIRIVNQETILGGTALGLSGYPCFNSPYEIGIAEVAAGFNVILHATNHVLDKGLKGVHNCLNFWHNNYPDTAVLGINESEEAYQSVYVYEKDGFKVAILNYTYGTNGIAILQSMPYVVDMLEEDKVRKDVALAKELADMVVVCPHWGTEYVYEPDSSQKYWTELFFSLGVDVVIGTHPHVLEPVELLVDEQTGRQMLVYYSLGNFVSDQDEKPRMIGGLAKVSLVKRGTDGSCFIDSYSLEPVITHKMYADRMITAYKLSDYTQELAAANSICKDSGNADFSLNYCKNLCRQILGKERIVSN